MEYNQMFPFMTPYLPKSLQYYTKFLDWLNTTENVMEMFASLLMMVLPGDRISFYRTNDIVEMRANVFE